MTSLRRRSVALLVVGVLVLAALGGAAALLLGGRGDDHDPAAAATPSAALLRARAGAIAFFTLDADHVQADVARVLDLATGPFRSSYRASRAEVLDRVRRNHLHVSATVPDDGAALESFAGSSAKVLVAVDVRTRTGTSTPTLEHYRARVGVVRAHGTWKVAALDQVPGRATPEAAADAPGSGLPGADGAPVAAAAAAMPAVLSYDHTALAAGLRRATQAMTPAFAAQFRRSFERHVRPLVLRKKVTTTAYVRDAALVRGDASTARVLVFADQVVRGPRPQVTEARVLVDLVRSGGTWLVAGITGT